MSDYPVTSLSDLNIADPARELAELLFSETDYEVFAYVSDRATDKVTYLYVQDGDGNRMILGQTTHVPWDWYVSFPIDSSLKKGTAVRLPIGMEEIRDAAHAVEVAQEYMGSSITPGRGHCEGVFGTDTYANHPSAGILEKRLVKVTA